MGNWRNGTGTLTVVDGPGAPVAVEIAASYGTRRRGLLGRDSLDGALLITPCGSVHTFRMRFAIDVAYLDKDLRVIDLHTLPPNRLPLPRPRARHVLEAAAGTMAEWGLSVGSRIQIRAEPPEGGGVAANGAVV